MKVTWTTRRYREDLADYDHAETDLWTEDITAHEAYEFLRTTEPSEWPLQSDHAWYMAVERDGRDYFERGIVTERTMHPTDDRMGKWLRVLWKMGLRRNGR